MVDRSSGILLHVSSLEGDFGIGRIGRYAHAFVDTLKSLGQTCWQILPLGPTGYGNSPYQALSAFAANELFICIDDLVSKGLLKPDEADEARVGNTGQVDFGQVIALNDDLLNRVARDFDKKASTDLRERFTQFRQAAQHWLDDYALFMVIKQQQGLKPWHQWPDALKHRDVDALAEIGRSQTGQIERIKLGQFLFFSQWQDLRQKARQTGIEIIGDMPIFIAHDSADSWCHPELLQLDKHGECTVVAGVPPDYFSKTGQRWGNPLYDWETHRRNDFSWWCERLDQAFTLTDIVRIDHFRGFQAYWEIPATEPTAIKGRWVDAPGKALFEHYLAHRPQSRFIAEDLGIITPAVEALIAHFDFPGMRVLQFAFDDDPENPHLPVNYPPACVAYPSTHDNNTLAGWLEDEASVQAIADATGLSKDEINVPSLIKLVMESNAQRVIIPMQDILNLGPECRMNTPSTTENNWTWRLLPGQIDAARLGNMCTLTRPRTPILDQAGQHG